jgi:hypothetical protein
MPDQVQVALPQLEMSYYGELLCVDRHNLYASRAAAWMGFSAPYSSALYASRTVPIDKKARVSSRSEMITAHSKQSMRRVPLRKWAHDLTQKTWTPLPHREK